MGRWLRLFAPAEVQKSVLGSKPVWGPSSKLAIAARVENSQLPIRGDTVLMVTGDANPVHEEFKNSAFNALLMIRFAASPIQSNITEALRSALETYAINLLRADQKAYSESLWTNVRHYMDACDLGIAVFEQLEADDYNPNVSLELGYMLAKQKNVLILKEQSLPRLQTDLVGHLYREFDSRDIARSVQTAALSWLRDIGVAKSQSEKIVLFVSHGGTCRCAMSKVVARKAFEGRTLPFTIRFESMAAVFGDSVRASNGARRAINEVYGEDLLESHRVMKRNVGVIRDADLILVMEANLLCELPVGKTHLITEFFDQQGNVIDPWPDSNVGAEERYRDCLAHLRSLIEPNANRLLQSLRRKSE